MSTIPIATAPRSAMRDFTLRNFVRRLSDALDAFAQSRVDQAVPESEMLRCQHEIHHYRRLMHKAGASPASRAASRT